MASNVERINPLDLQPRKGVGLEIPFSANNVFTLNYTTAEALKNNLATYFLTGRGERYLNPEFGSPLRPLLFDQMTEEKTTQIKTVVETDLGIYFPQVEPLEIEVEGIPERNLVQFALRYRINNTNISDEIVIDFEL